MALHDPVEDALNARKKKARLVEAGAAIGTPDKEALDITSSFLGSNVGTLQGGRRNIRPPGAAAGIAGRRAFGQRGAQQGSLRDRFFDLPGPVGFASTPQGQAVLQRILRGFGGRR